MADNGGIFTQKYGPLPLWGWMGLGLGGAYVYSKKKGGSSAQSQQAQQQAALAQQQLAQQQAAQAAGVGDSAAYGDQTPPYILQNYTSQVTATPSSSTTGTPSTANHVSVPKRPGPPSGWGQNAPGQTGQPHQKGGSTSSTPPAGLSDVAIGGPYNTTNANSPWNSNYGDIAQKYGTSVSAIQAANPDVNMYDLQQGQQILVPTGGSSSGGSWTGSGGGGSGRGGMGGGRGRGGSN